MNVSNLANLFQQNSVLQPGQPLGQTLRQPLASDTMQRLSENFLAAQEQDQDLRKRFDTLELSGQAADSSTDPALSEMPTELLEMYLNQYKVAAHLSYGNETALMEYRDQLTAFDQTIQEYQDMLDGKAALPQKMKPEDVTTLLERTRAAREEFLQKGAERLSCAGSGGPALTDKAWQMAAGSQDSGGKLLWSIDASAGDIYGEIDRALASAHKVTSICREGASRIVAELKRRGQADQPYHQLNFDEEERTAGRTFLFQDIYEDVYSKLQNTQRLM